MLIPFLFHILKPVMIQTVLKTLRIPPLSILSQFALLVVYLLAGFVEFLGSLIN